LSRKGVHLLADDVAMDALIKDITANGREEHNAPLR
jgi:hypothetical protein